MGIAGQVRYVAGGDHAPAGTARERVPTGIPRPRLLDRVRERIRARHHSRRTEKAYIHWIKRYIFFHDKRHPAEMGAAEVTSFLTALAVRDRVTSSTQNQALTCGFRTSISRPTRSPCATERAARTG
jgi:hypothetical protein